MDVAVSKGYVFQMEMIVRATRAGLAIEEVSRTALYCTVEFCVCCCTVLYTTFQCSVLRCVKRIL